MRRGFGRLILGLLLGALLGRAIQRMRQHRARGRFDPDGPPGWEPRGGHHHHHEHHRYRYD